MVNERVGENLCERITHRYLIGQRSLVVLILFPHLLPLLPMALFTPTDATCVATIRVLAADIVGKANSGHPGKPRPSRPVLHTDDPPTRCTHGHGPCRPRTFHKVNVVLQSSLAPSSQGVSGSSTRIQVAPSGSIATASCSPTGMLPLVHFINDSYHLSRHA